MAKVKTAVATIKSHLKAKGLDADEIKGVFEELEAADADLDQLAQAIDDNLGWQRWYGDFVPQVREVISERDQLKELVGKLEAAGITLGGGPSPQAPSNPQPPMKGFDPEAFTKGLTSATSNVMKNVAVYGLRHFKKYGEEPDYDAIEKLMTEKGVPFDVAYGIWEEPKRTKKQEEDIAEKIKKGIQEGIQAERTRMGLNRTRRKSDDLDVPSIADTMKTKKDEGPSDHELRNAFIKDLDDLANTVTH